LGQPTVNTAARAVLGLAALAGLLLTWLTYDWLGNPWDHCDYPEECLGTWFPRAFEVIQYMWAATALVAGAGVVLSSLGSWRRADTVILGASWVALFVPLAVTPMYGGGQAMTAEQVETNPFLWASDGYRFVAIIICIASLVMGWQAVRPRARREHRTRRRLARDRTGRIADN
jgi:hypothetical protein